MGRGRKTGGPNLVEGAEGSDEAKRRSKAVLEVLAGGKTVVEASAELGMGEAMFHRLKTRFIQSGVESLEPRPMGRPVAARPPSPEVEALSERVKELEWEIKSAEVREEIAVAMPHLKKKRRRGR